MTGQKVMLIADDIYVNRQLLKKIFEKEYYIYEAKDGVEALELIEKEQSKLTVILLDICMPGLNGLEVIQYLRQNETLKEIPIIAITGEDLSEIEILENGAWDYLSKPFNSELVKIRVENTVSRKLLSDFREQKRKLESELEIRNLEKKNLEVLKRENALLQERYKEQERYKILTKQTGSIVFELNFESKKFFISDNVKEYLIGRIIDTENIEILEENSILEWVYRKKQKLDKLGEGIYLEDKEKLLNEFFERLIKGESFAKTTVRLKKENGIFVWCRVSGNCIYNKSGALERVVGTIKNVHNEVEYLNKLKRDAEYDALTGTYNKIAFFKYSRELMSDYPEETFAILRLDINRFKVINELFGHGTGDCLIKYMAEMIQKILYEYDQYLFSRMEADVFCICIKYKQKKFEVILEKLEHIADGYELNFDIVPSIGIYIVEEKDILVDVMCDRAKLAQDTVKGNYLKRHAFFDETLHKNMIKEQEIVNMMNSALEKGEFQVYLQPKFNLNSNLICGAEALVRWFHPQKGIIFPNEFIPVFERNGFIMKLDEYVWEKVCQFLRKELDEERNICPISVNISRVDLYNPRLCDVITGLVEKYNIPVKYFQLEITESAYTDNKNLLHDIMKRLQDYGFVMMMDDFGSGYSSLNMLKEIPVDVLKVDLKFLSGEDKNGKGGNILSSVIRMAKWLNLQVITEGIETKEQADFLRSIGCTDGQGYYFAKSMPMEEYEILMENNKNGKFSQPIEFSQKINIDEFWDPNSKLGLLFNSMVSAIGIYEWNQENLEVLRLSDSYFEMIGISREEFAKDGLHVMNCVFEEDQDIVKKMFEMSYENKGIGEGVYRRKAKSGKVIWLHTRVRYIAGDKKNSIYFAIMNDVSKEKEYEEQLKIMGEKLKTFNMAGLE